MRSLRWARRAVQSLTAAVVLGVPAAAGAATITVDSSGDTVGNDGNCILREAVINANNDDTSGSIDCATGAGADVIDLSTSVTLSTPGDDDAAALGDLDVTEDLTIQGIGPVAINGMSGARIFEVPAGPVDLTLNDLELNGGSITTPETGEPAAEGGAIRFRQAGQLDLSNTIVHNASVTDPSDANRGGGIYVESGSHVTIRNGSAIDDNQAGVGLSAFATGSPAGGGGIYAEGAGVQITVDSGSEVSGNVAGAGAADAQGNGGGISFGGSGAGAPSLTLIDATLSGNSAGGDGTNALGGGGGLYVQPVTSPTVNITDSTVSGNHAGGGPGDSFGSGGGIAVDTGQADVNLSGATVRLNTAGGNGGDGSAWGGGIYTQSGIEIGGSTISLNAAGIPGSLNSLNVGGGIYLLRGNQTTTNPDANIHDSTISGNFATGSGGGIKRAAQDNQAFPDDTLSRVTIANNHTGGSLRAGQGAGLSVESGGTTTIDSSTLSGNVTDGPAGTPSQGAGILAESASGAPVGPSGSMQPGSLSLTNSTVSGNQAAGGEGGDGGGLATVADGTHLAPAVQIVASTLAGNEADATGSGGSGGNLNLAEPDAGSVTLLGSIVADGAGDAGQENCVEATAGAIDSLGGNVEGNAAAGGPTSQCALDQPNDRHADPMLAALAPNGGPTQTREILGDSPAVDLYTAGCPATDQRGTGFPRSLGGACDAGAFEATPLPPVTTTPPPSTTPPQAPTPSPSTSSTTTPAPKKKKCKKKKKKKRKTAAAAKKKTKKCKKKKKKK